MNNRLMTFLVRLIILNVFLTEFILHAVRSLLIVLTASSISFLSIISKTVDEVFEKGCCILKLDVFQGTCSGKRDQEMDFIKILPEEVSVMILRQLNGKALLSCSLVCQNWYHFCNFHAILSGRIEEEKKIAAIREAFKSYERDIILSIFLSLIYDFLFDIYQAVHFFVMIPFRVIEVLKM